MMDKTLSKIPALLSNASLNDITSSMTKDNPNKREIADRVHLPVDGNYESPAFVLGISNAYGAGSVDGILPPGRGQKYHKRVEPQIATS